MEVFDGFRPRAADVEDDVAEELVSSPFRVFGDFVVDVVDDLEVGVAFDLHVMSFRSYFFIPPYFVCIN